MKKLLLFEDVGSISNDGNVVVDAGPKFLAVAAGSWYLQLWRRTDRQQEMLSFDIDDIATVEDI